MLLQCTGVWRNLLIHFGYHLLLTELLVKEEKKGFIWAKRTEFKIHVRIFIFLFLPMKWNTWWEFFLCFKFLIWKNRMFTHKKFYKDILMKNEMEKLALFSMLRNSRGNSLIFKVCTWTIFRKSKTLHSSAVGDTAFDHQNKSFI